MKLIKLISAIFITLFACPESYCDGAVEVQVNSFNDLLDAIAVVESNNNPNAYNKKENAAGAYQIRPIYLKDVNRILRYPKYKLADRFDSVKSREMVGIYLRHWGKGKGIEQMARIHNGGPHGDKKKATVKYWLKVKKVLEVK